MSRNLLYMPGSLANRIFTWSRYDKASSTYDQKWEREETEIITAANHYFQLTRRFMQQDFTSTLNKTFAHPHFSETSTHIKRFNTKWCRVQRAHTLIIKMCNCFFLLHFEVRGQITLKVHILNHKCQDYCVTTDYIQNGTCIECLRWSSGRTTCSAGFLTNHNRKHHLQPKPQLMVMQNNHTDFMPF